jgi:hypothetical protein
MTTRHHWGLLLFLLFVFLLFWAIYKADQGLAWLAAVGMSVAMIWFRLTSPVFWISTILAWLAAFFWGSPTVQKIFGTVDDTVTGLGLGGANNPDTSNPG